MKKIRNIFIIALCIILFVYLSICINSYINGNKIGIFSFRFYIMSSNSSDSGVNSGDLVIAKNVKIEDIKENDDIIYKRNDSLVVKKIKIVENNNGHVNFYIQDDNVINNEKVENAQIIGKVIFSINGFGNFALFAQSPIGTCSILAIAVCIFIIINKIVKTLTEGKAHSECKETKIKEDEKIEQTYSNKNEKE